MLKKIGLTVIILTLLVPICIGLSEQVEQKPTYLERQFEIETYDIASHVFTGEVVKVVSKWVNTSKSNLIYTFATVEISNYDKGQGNDEVVVRYKGGVVGNIGSVVCYTPHGIVDMKKGQQVIVFSKQPDENDIYETWYVKHLKKKSTTNPVSGSQDYSTLGYDYLDDIVIKTEFTELDDVYEIDDEGFVFMGNRHWDTDAFPIPYEINCYGTSDCTGEYTAVQDAFDNWEDVSSCEMAFDYDGTTLDEESYDGTNVVDWETDEGSNDVGYNHYWYYQGTGEVIESDIVANDKYEFCIGLVSGEYDVENLMTHEVGHYFVLWDLWDPDNSAKTMYHEVDDCQISRRSLHSGDIAGARYVYPE